MTIALVLLVWFALAFVVGTAVGRSLKNGSRPLAEPAGGELTRPTKRAIGSYARLAERRELDAA